MRQLKITKSITNRESQSLDKYLQDIGKEELITAEEEVEAETTDDGEGEGSGATAIDGLAVDSIVAAAPEEGFTAALGLSSSSSV